MRSVSVVLLLAVVAMASAAPTSDKPHYDVSNANLTKTMFEDFIKEHNRNYKNEEDKEVHYRAFVESLKKINKLNEGDSSATYGINKFADYTEEERSNMFGFGKKRQN